MTPALKPARSLTMPRALYVVRIGMSVRRPSSVERERDVAGHGAAVRPRADAGDDDRAPRVAEQVAHGREVGRGPRRRRGPGRRTVPTDRSRRAPGPDADRGQRATIARGSSSGSPPNATDAERRRCHQGELVDALVRDAVALGRADAVGDEHHRLAVEQRLGDAVDGARRARATRDHARSRRTGQLADDTGHDRGRRLGVGQHEAHAALVHRADDVEVRTTARHPEHH